MALVNPEGLEFREHIGPAKQHGLADFQVRQFPLAHPEIDRANGAPDFFRKFVFYEKIIACAVGDRLYVIVNFHAQILRVFSLGMVTASPQNLSQFAVSFRQP